MDSDRKETGYRKLVAWQLSHELVLLIYKYTRDFPRDELHGLTNQIRRAAVSVPANIVEGYARASRKEFIQFLYISYASLAEVEYYLELVRDLKYLPESICETLEAKRLVVGKVLFKLIMALKK
jgi:four helix bundle protein